MRFAPAALLGLLAALALTPIWIGFLGWSLYRIALALFHHFE